MQYVAGLILIFGIILLCFSAAYAQTTVAEGNRENSDKNITENQIKDDILPLNVQDESEDIILLIISSSDIPVYDQLRNLSRLYLQKESEKSNGKFRYFFVELGGKSSTRVSLNGDMLIVHDSTRTESVSTIFFKTQEAIRYINQHYNYKVIIRTNLSSFWNIYNLQELCATFDSNTFAGFSPFDTFISGTGIMMGKNVATYVSGKEKRETENNEQKYDDVLISQFASERFPVKRLEKSVVHFMVDDDENKYPADVKQPLYYRVKNQDRTNDVKIFQELLLKIYDIKIKN